MMTTTRTWPIKRWHLIGVVVFLAGLYMLASPVVSAHGVSSKDARVSAVAERPGNHPAACIWARSTW